MVAAIRNLGRPGISSMAIAAVDNALWDLKARILDLPLVSLLGQVRTAVPIYGSGGFTSYIGDGTAKATFRLDIERNSPRQDEDRPRTGTRILRASLLPATLSAAIASSLSMPTAPIRRKQALAMASSFAESDVSWFEEPVSKR